MSVRDGIWALSQRAAWERRGGRISRIGTVGPFRRRPHVFNGEHHWVLGEGGLSAADFRALAASSGLTVARDYRPAETPRHPLLPPPKSMTTCLLGRLSAPNAAVAARAATPALAFVSLRASEFHRRFGSRVLVTDASEGSNSPRRSGSLRRAAPINWRYGVVIVTMGVNDGAQREREAEDPAADVPPVAAAPRCAAAGSWLRRPLGCPCVPSAGYGSAPIDGYCSVLEDVAEEAKCAFADVTTAWARARRRPSPPDGVNHPDDVGHALYADVVLHALLRGIRAVSAAAGDERRCDCYCS